MTSTSSSSQMPVAAMKMSLDSTGSRPAPHSREHAMEYHAFIRTLGQDTPSIPSAAVDYDTVQASHHQDPTTREYPPTTLTFFDTFLNPTSPAPSAPLLTVTPTAPAPVLHRPSIREAPVFDADEILHIFPIELPPRPPRKQGFFARMFKRDPRSDNIELGRTTDPHALQRWGDSLSKRQKDNLVWWGFGWVVIVGLIAWITLTEIHQGKAKYSEDNGQW